MQQLKQSPNPDISKFHKIFKSTCSSWRMIKLPSKALSRSICEKYNQIEIVGADDIQSTTMVRFLMLKI